MIMTVSSTKCYQQVYFQYLLANANSATYLPLQVISSTASNTGDNALNDSMQTREQYKDCIACQCILMY